MDTIAKVQGITPTPNGFAREKIHERTPMVWRWNPILQRAEAFKDDHAGGYEWCESTVYWRVSEATFMQETMAVDNTVLLWEHTWCEPASRHD